MLTFEENCHYFRQKHTNTHHISSYNSSYLAKLDAAFLFLFFFFFFNFLVFFFYKQVQILLKKGKELTQRT